MTMHKIAVVDVGTGGARAIAEAHADRLHDLYGCARRLYTPPVLAIGDALSRRWLDRTANPFIEEIRAIADMLPGAGGHLLNMSYEWCCTTGTAPDPNGPGARMLRTLDWRLKGLGRNLVVARQEGPAGEYLNITWPGVVGIYTAVAKRRFAAAINQTPLRSRSYFTLPADWVAARRRQLASSDIPPAHLLRQVFETCRTYADAKEMLARTPICLPVFFTLSGIEPDQGCVIERTESDAIVHESPAAIANCWIGAQEPGRPRGHMSGTRRERMKQALATARGGFDWVVEPILNRDTRLAAELNARAGTLRVQGYERDGVATEMLELVA